MFGTYAVIAIIQSVALVALFLIALGLGLSALTWWFWTTAKPEPISLAPLEIMSDRRYSRASQDEQKLMIDSAHDLVNAAKSPGKPRQKTQPPERQTPPQHSPGKPVDPLLK